MRLRSRVFYSSVLSLALSLDASAQIDLTSWPQVRMHVLVVRPRNTPKMQLGSDSISIRDAGKWQSVLEVKPAAAPESVCLVLQSSKRMADGWKDVEAVARRLLEGLPESDEVCVIDFAFQTNVDAEFTQDRAKAVMALSSIPLPNGGTALWDALIATGEYMRKRSHYKDRMIILVSTCDDNDSTGKSEELQHKLEVGGSPVVYAIKVPQGRDATDASEQQSRRAALMLTKLGGAVGYFPRRWAELEASAEQLLEALQDRYVVTYQSSNITRTGERKLEVKLKPTAETHDVFISAPEGYYAPSQ